MPDQSYVSPKTLKIIVLFVAIFFILAIIFNVWIRSALKETNDVSVVTTETTTRQKIEKQPPAKNPKIIRRESRERDIEYDEASGSEGPLLLQ